ncbi:unnamed protein product [Bursaphelenchus xylophilus]|uniref:(pine wood nematode) hypothetical protein n=1 Tax=Bursaphelenchus xylophilus TaxID=6326 RepID=A0A7I8X2Z6_BURXY|nr:unnamed protein product [Bursaphelenchus xylophilus]CAG9131080.1 unnamed protein product [Bursaphelenchus xylophilus]
MYAEQESTRNAERQSSARVLEAKNREGCTLLPRLRSNALIPRPVAPRFVRRCCSCCPLGFLCASAAPLIWDGAGRGGGAKKAKDCALSLPHTLSAPFSMGAWSAIEGIEWDGCCSVRFHPFSLPRLFLLFIHIRKVGEGRAKEWGKGKEEGGIEAKGCVL